MNQYQVSFTDAIKRAFSQYCCFTGRASRSEFWWFALFSLIIGAVISILFNDKPSVFEKVSWAFSIIMFLPSWGLCFRRLHDTNHSGWNSLWVLIPEILCMTTVFNNPILGGIFGLLTLIGTIILLVFLCKPSDPEPNKYGPMPNPIL